MSAVHVSTRPWLLCLLAGACAWWAVGCDRVTPNAQASSPPMTKTWTDIPAARPEDRVTVHYHRADGQYDAAEIWTWDVNQKTTPKQNVLAALGRDDFGTVYQFNRADYGGSDKVGLITRLGRDWSRKDGGDKIWTAALGNEVWLVNGNNTVRTQRPDVTPHLVSAYLDAPNRLVVALSEQTPLPVKVSVVDQADAAHVVEGAFPAGAGASFQLTVLTKESLDVVRGRYRVGIDGFGAAVPVVPRGVLEDRDLFYDADVQLGATYDAARTVFRLFAPTAATVNVVLYDAATGDAGRTVHALQARDKGIWEATVEGDLQGKCYAYALDGPAMDPKREVIDPYATNAVASSTRGLLSPPVATPRPGPRPASPTDAVVYEMHVRDFTVAKNSGVQRRGLYPGFVEAGTRLSDDAEISTALDHLVELGVTHVELLPVMDYENNEAAPAYNWGYISTNFFSPDGAYATNPDDDSRVRELKGLVDALHARGLGVILDVVYNHTAPEATFNSVVPGYYYRHKPDGTPEDGSACGNDFRTEAPMARKLILDSLCYWAREYAVDGYRFDLMALIDQETMREAERRLKEINPSIILYGEPWMATSSSLPNPSDKKAVRALPVGAFNDDFRNALKGSPDGKDAGFIQTGARADAFKAALQVTNWFAEPWQSVNYMTCHDNLVLWDKLKNSSPQADDAQLIETMKLGYLALFTAQGLPFLHGGEEFARTKGGNDNSYDAGDKVNEIDWSLKQRHRDLFEYTRAAIALRKTHPIFRLGMRQEVAKRLKFVDTPNAKTIAYTLDAMDLPGETWKRACVLLNSDAADAEVSLPEGDWTVAMDERGPADDRPASGNLRLRSKSGVVLYQK